VDVAGDPSKDAATVLLKLSVAFEQHSKKVISGGTVEFALAGFEFILFYLRICWVGWSSILITMLVIPAQHLTIIF
jgi:hypothetical protein